MEIKANEGVIFRNDKKTPENKQPDYKGQVNCEGIIKDIALWVRKSKDGMKSYFSVKLQEPYKMEMVDKIPPKFDKETLRDEPEDQLPF